MISLTSTLEAAQKAGGDALWKVVFTKSGETTRTFGADTTNRIPEGFPIIYTRNDWLQDAEVTVDNREGNLTALDLKGYQAIISFGYVTSSGDEYQGTAVMKCIAQRFGSGQSRQGDSDLLCFFSLAGHANQMAEDIASVAFEPDSSNADTIKIIVTSIVEATMPCFSHTEAFTLNWELTAFQEDELANAFQPANFLRVHKGQSRLEVLKSVLEYTGLDGRFEGDGQVHVFQTFARVWTADSSIDQNEITKPATPSDWIASTAYSLNDRVKPTTQNGYYYVCSTAGTSATAGNEPSWPTKDGNTVTDGTAVWTCRDTNYIFTCTTQGATDSTEPVWTYAKDDTITDGGVVWTLQYDYDYDDVSTGHNFWRKGIRKSVVMPNKITILNPPRAVDPFSDAPYSGSATEPASFADIPIEITRYLTITGDADATASEKAADIALAMIDRAARNAEAGDGFTMLNVGQEIHDYILTTDSWEGDAVRGRIRSITCYAGPGLFKMTFGFASRLTQSPMGVSRNPGLSLPDPVPAWAYDILDLIDRVDAARVKDVNNLHAIITQMQISVPDWHVTRRLRIPVRDKNGYLVG